MVQPTKNIVIVGGSLAGLMTGLVLKRLGHTVRILERSPTPLLQTQGAGIVFGSKSQEYFSKFIKTKRKFSVSSFLRQTLNKDGESIPEHEQRYEQKMVSWDLVYFVLRWEFDGYANEYVDTDEAVSVKYEGKATYEYGSKAVDVRDKGEKVELAFEDRDGNVEKVEADMVIGADGPSSTIRKILTPEVERKYAGYVAWRGTILESDASKELKDTFVDHFTFFHDHRKGIQTLTYLIPGAKGTLEPGSRLINWVWYCNYPEDSNEYKDLMTDSGGHFHHYTLPSDGVQERLWRKQKGYAAEVLPSQFSKLVQQTTSPFVQAITDVISPKASFFDGKVLLVGDAVAGFRPHTAASTSQAALHAIFLDRVMRGEMTWDEMLENMVDHARYMSNAGIRMGNRSQFSRWCRT